MVLICKADGCSMPIIRSERGGRPRKFCSAMCKDAWYKAQYVPKPPRQERTCSLDGCGAKHEAKGLCKRHYLKWKREIDPSYRERENARRRESRRGNPEYLAYEARRRQDPRVRAIRRKWTSARTQRLRVARYPEFAVYWEKQRAAEDATELRDLGRKLWPRCRTSDRPRHRTFVAGECFGCGEPFVVIEGWWHGSNRCSSCTSKYWKQGNHRKRARRYGGEYEPIEPSDIFNRDGWRCQICGVKVHRYRGGPGKGVDRRGATIDHIVPLARGGDHIEENVQCACWECNTRKGAGAANDQLRLVA